MKTFNEQIIDLLKDMAIAALEALKMTLVDFSSFRNRLIGFVCLMCLVVVLSDKAQPGIQVSAFGILGVIVSYYFKTRIDSQKIEQDREEEEDEKDR